MLADLLWLLCLCPLQAARFGCSARTCSEPSVLSIRFPLCVLMYVNLGLVRLLWSREQNTRLHWCQKRRRLTDGSQHRAGLLWVASKHNPSLKCWFCFTEKGRLSFSSCSFLSTLSAVSAPTGPSFGAGVWCRVGRGNEASSHCAPNQL